MEKSLEIFREKVPGHKRNLLSVWEVNFKACTHIIPAIARSPLASVGCLLKDVVIIYCCYNRSQLGRFVFTITVVIQQPSWMPYTIKVLLLLLLLLLLI